MGLFDDLEAEFNASEDGTTDDPLSQVVSDLEQPVPQDDTDGRFAEFDRRVAKAEYYRTIVRAGVVEDNGTQEAREVNAEARKWAADQFERSFSGASPATEAAPVAQFTEEEAAILRSLIEKVKLAQGAQKVPTPTPVITKQPPPPAVKKVAPRPAPPTAPVEKKPAAKKPAQPAAPKPKPPTPTAAAAEKPKFLKVLPKTKNAQGETVTNYNEIPVGVIFKEHNRFWKIIETSNGEHGKIQVASPEVKGRAGIVQPQTKEQIEAAMLAASQASVNTGQSGNTIFRDEQGGKDAMVLAAVGSLRKQD